MSVIVAKREWVLLDDRSNEVVIYWVFFNCRIPGFRK